MTSGAPEGRRKQVVFKREVSKNMLDNKRHELL